MKCHALFTDFILNNNNKNRTSSVAILFSTFMVKTFFFMFRMCSFKHVMEQFLAKPLYNFLVCYIFASISSKCVHSNSV